MKRMLRPLLGAFFGMLLFALPASADFTDDCVSAQGDGWHTYHNLAATTAGPAVDFDWPSAPDRTALAVTSPQSGLASALYAVENAQDVEISLYTIFATFATVRNSSYLPGCLPGGSTAQAKRLLFSDSSGLVYLKSDGWYVLQRDEYGEHVFTPLSSPPAGTLSSYGVSVFCSSNGSSFSSVPVSLRTARNALADRSGFPCYYETYSASVPAGTRFIRVELREMGSIPLVSGGSVSNSTRGSMRLASVTFTGNAVRGSLSGPPPSSSVPSDSASSSSTPTPSSSNSLQPSSSSDSSSLSDPDLETPLPRPDVSQSQGGHGNTSEKSSRSSSKASKSSASSKRSSASSSRASSRASSRSSSKKSSSSAASSVAEELSQESNRAYEPVLHEVYSAPPREADTRTILLGGGYLVFAAVLLVIMARKK